MYALTDSAEGDCYLSVPPDPGIEAAALGASASAAPSTSESAAPGAGESALSGTAPTEALHTFTLDSGASRSFFRDSTTLTPRRRPVAVSVADPSGGPVLAHSSTVLQCPAAPLGLLSGLHLPSFSTNLVSGADLQDAWVDHFTPGGQRVTHCTCSRTGRHLATFNRQPGSSQYTLTTVSLLVSASGHVAASGQVFAAASRSSRVSAPCSCRPLTHENFLWHHRLGHPSLPRLRGMASRTLVSGLPRKDEVPETEGGEFSSDLLRAFCRAEGIRQTFTLPASPQQNGIAERRIGMVMDVARTSMIHAAAPHFLWPFAVQYAAHQINLQPCVSLPETTPTMRWTRKVGDASAFRVWGSRAFVRDSSADKLSSRVVPCVFLGFPPDAPGWQFYHPTSRESVSYSGPTPSSVSQVDPVELVEVAVDSGAARGAEPAGARTGGAGSGGAEPAGAGTGGVESGGAEPERVEPGGAEPGGCGPLGGLSRACPSRGVLGHGGPSRGGPRCASPSRGGLRCGGQGRGRPKRRSRVRIPVCALWASQCGGVSEVHCGWDSDSAAAGGTAGAGAAGGAASSGGARTGGTRADGAGGAAGVGVAGTGACGAAGVVAGDPEGTGAVSAIPGGAARPRPYYVPLLQQPASALPSPSPYFGPTRGLTERREPESRPVSPESRPESPESCSESPNRTVRAGRRVTRPRPPPVPGTHSITLRPSTAPQRVPLPSPPASSLHDGPDPESDSLRAASPTVTRFLATATTDPLFESTAASALVAELVDFAAACRLDYDTSLVAESAFASVCPPSIGGECALGTDVLEDRQEEFECFAAAVPHLVSMLLAPEGDPDAPDIPTPRSYAEAIEGPYSSQWQAAMDAQMASWKSTGTYVDEVPPPGANIVSGMRIFRVKRPPGCPPIFKARYVARGFSQRQGVDFFQTFSPTLKMTTLQVLLHVATQRDYELHSLDFSTAFLQGSLHEEIWLRRPPGFTGSFLAGTQWSLRRPVYGLRQAPREWHDTLRTTLATLGFAPSTADPSLFLRTDTTLPPFYVLVYIDDLVFAVGATLRFAFGLLSVCVHACPIVTLTFATADTEALGHVKSELQKRHTCTDLGELTSYLGLRITRDRAQRTITLTQSHMVHQALQHFGFTYSSPLSTPLPTGHSLSAPPSDESVEPSGPYQELVGYLILRSGSVSWRSTRSSSVLSSSCEAEIYARAMAALELRWLTYLLTDLGEPPRSPPTLYVDNKAMLALCQEHRLEHRTNQIALRYFFARELQQRGQLRLAYVASQANIADVFTKALQPCDHQRFYTVLGLVPTVPRLLSS
ncbi:unnamed protein product [Closterium sp. NIES-54]